MYITHNYKCVQAIILSYTGLTLNLNNVSGFSKIIFQFSATYRLSKGDVLFKINHTENEITIIYPLLIGLRT